MAHKVCIGGTAYEIDGGKAMVGGTVYEIDHGVANVDGTAYEVGFGPAMCTVTFPNGNGVYSKYQSNYAGVDNINGEALPWGNTETEVPVGSVMHCYYYTAQRDASGRGTIIVNGATVSTKAFEKMDAYRKETYDFTITKDTTVMFSSGDYDVTITITEQ